MKNEKGKMKKGKRKGKNEKGNGKRVVGEKLFVGGFVSVIVINICKFELEYIFELVNIC